MALAIIAAAYLGYGLVSQRLRSTVFTAPMVFTGLGLLIGPLGLALVSTNADPGLATGVFEVTLVLVLFSDAYAIDAARLVRERTLPLRLLAIGLPLTIGLGWAVAAVMFAGLDVWEAALVGAVLAPTDASLAQTVIVDRRVPHPIRDGLNVESGLNDGIALPFVLLFLGFATEAAGEGGQSVVEIFVRALIFSALIGGLTGWISGRLVVGARKRHWAAATWYPLVLLAAALFAYAAAGLVDGSGFIAAWVAGLTAGMAVRRRTRTLERDDQLAPAAEDQAAPTFLDGLGVLLTSASYLVFGALLLGPELASFTAPVLIFAVLALTVVRMAPVALSLVRTRLGRPTVAFVGWFGPRGLASIVFTFLVIEDELPGVPLIATIVAATVTLSIVAHGVSSAWGTRRYSAWYEAAAERDPSMPEAAEHTPVGGRRAIALAGSGVRHEPEGR